MLTIPNQSSGDQQRMDLIIKCLTGSDTVILALKKWERCKISLSFNLTLDPKTGDVGCTAPELSVEQL